MSLMGTPVQSSPKRWAPRGEAALRPTRSDRFTGSAPVAAYSPRRMPEQAARREPLIVGIGASAGGLDALQRFFQRVPADSGLVYVVMTHAPIAQKSLLAPLLERQCKMPVVEVGDRVTVAADHVYVAQAGQLLTLEDGALVTNGSSDGAHRHFIDAFFRSLAANARERAIGVVLSGTGSDGTLGIKEIKAQSGMTMAQEEATARYGAMPHSAIASLQVDYVLPPEQMADQLLKYARKVARRRERDEQEGAQDTDQFGRIFALLRTRTGHDFSLYKGTTIRRRIERRMNVHQLESLSDYLHFLRAERAGDRPAVQGAADRGHLVLPGSRRARAAGEHGVAGADGRQATELHPAAVGGRLLHRRGGLLAGHPAQGGDGAEPGRTRRADLRHRPGPRGHRGRPPGRLSREHRRGRQPGAPGPVLHPGGGGLLPDQEGDPGDAGVRPAQPDRRSPVHQAGPAVLPEPAHLPRERAAEAADADLPLQPAAGRGAVPGIVGDGGRFRGPVRHHRQEVEAVPAPGGVVGQPLRRPGAGRAGFAGARSAGGRPGGQGAGAGGDSQRRAGDDASSGAPVDHHARTRGHRAHPRPHRAVPGTGAGRPEQQQRLQHGPGRAAAGPGGGRPARLGVGTGHRAPGCPGEDQRPRGLGRSEGQAADPAREPEGPVPGGVRPHRTRARAARARAAGPG